MSEQLAPAVATRLMKEIRALIQKPIEGIQVSLMEDQLTNIIADIDGPEDTPFQGGVFRIRLLLDSDFPHSPPKGYFVTKIFHPNVSEKGEICVNTLKKDWLPSHGLAHVLMVIRCLLIEPNPASALNEEAGKMLLEQYEDYFKRAQLMTSIHAKPRGGEDGKENKQNAADRPGSKASGASGKEIPVVKEVGVPLKDVGNKDKVAAAAQKKKALKRL